MTSTWTAADIADAERRYTTGLALTPRQVAHILNLTHQRGSHRGEPDRLRALDLIATGRLHPVDPTQPTHRLTVSAAEIRRHLTPTTITHGDAA